MKEPMGLLKSPSFRFGVLVVLGIVSIAVLVFSPLRDFLDLERAYETFKEAGEHPWAPAALVLAYVVLGMMGAPVVPLMVTGGALFGVVLGSVVNFAGVVLSSGASYWVGRTLGRDLVSRMLGSRRAALEGLIDRRGFWGMLRLRFVPVPFPITNYGAALLGVPWRTFIGGTAAGFAFVVPVWSYFAAALTSVADGDRTEILRNLTIAAVLMALLTFLPQWLVAQYRKRQAR